MAEIMPSSIKSEEVQICERLIFPVYEKNAHTYIMHTYE